MLLFAVYSLHLTSMCLQYVPTVVACVCIHLACKWSSFEVLDYLLLVFDIDGLACQFQLSSNFCIVLSSKTNNQCLVKARTL